jgi:hypothetical protein
MVEQYEKYVLLSSRCLFILITQNLRWDNQIVLIYIFIFKRMEKNFRMKNSYLLSSLGFNFRLQDQSVTQEKNS